ncbi:MAG: N(4)-(beta-N-acetylglucosaminyl)-L-asparaginase [Bacteroidales bacterium]|jgi:N4-(beta-N-acetylglucosaminyl)-L-asparaginase|nr:N(4)-(beta-N-acetylglucosaminyl)-L-asparaginase [Bacteroidales bacterium]
MATRRNFLHKLGLASAALLSTPNLFANKAIQKGKNKINHSPPIVISTWSHGIEANAEAVRVLNTGGSALGAVESGVRVVEADENNHSVGIGGYPDASGRVSLDASIMDHQGNAGAVCYLEDIIHPISVARKVMEETPHVMLAGNGALDFALQQGFNRQNLLTPKMEKEWKKWTETSEYKPVVNFENHDTIGLLVLDNENRLAGACTTSGMMYKLPGRVGDSPIIGAGLFVDGEVGAATATGMGELMMKTLGSFLIVELMRNGHSAQESCEIAIKRIWNRYSDDQNSKFFQVGYLALSKDGDIGAYSILPGFQYALAVNGENKLFDADFFIKG